MVQGDCEGGVAGCKGANLGRAEVRMWRMREAQVGCGRKCEENV